MPPGGEGRRSSAKSRLEDRQVRDAENFRAHPALVDASLHLALQAALAAEQGKLIVPFSVRGVRLHRPGRHRAAHPSHPAGGEHARPRSCDHADAEVLSIDGLVARPIDINALQNAPRA